MRCPKCGRISFDHLESCRKCGTDLTGLREQLGEFFSPNSSLNWFELLRGSSVQEHEEPAEAGGLGSLDVSDLTSPAPAVEEVVDLNPEDLEEAAVSEELDRALDGLMGDLERE